MLIVLPRAERRCGVPAASGGISPDQATVAAAIAAASPGDTITLAAGSATWTSNVTISKAGLRIVGQGIGQTTIAVSGTKTVLTIAANSVRITGITFSGGAVVNISSGSAWRVHHCQFTSNAFDTAVFLRGASKTTQPYGLVDHCDFYNTRCLSQVWPATIASELTGSSHFTLPLGLGTDAAMYVEDSTFLSTVATNAMDENHAGKYVFRHNEVTDYYVEAHSVQGYHRASRSWEIYANQFIQVSRTMSFPMYLRGGTGVVYDNTITGTWGLMLAFDLVRCHTDLNPESYPQGFCDGTSDWDGNTVGMAGYPGRDQIGRAIDDGAWPASAPYPAQTLTPAYIWNSTITYLGGAAVPLTAYAAFNSPDYIQADRDFYQDATGTFDGTSGVGRGLRSARPETGLVAGVGYWATDEATLYVATDATTWAVHYTPYTYPHPQQAID